MFKKFLFLALLSTPAAQSMDGEHLKALTVSPFGYLLNELSAEIRTPEEILPEIKKLLAEGKRPSKLDRFSVSNALRRIKSGKPVDAYEATLGNTYQEISKLFGEFA